MGALEEETYHKNDVVIKQGDDGSILYLVSSGELKCSKLINKVDTFI